MNANQQKQATLLTYAGLLPLVLALVNQFLRVVPIDSLFWAASYAAVIASFICGIHWAVFLFFAGRSPINLLLTSNLICLSAWAALLLPAAWPVLVILILCFIVTPLVVLLGSLMLRPEPPSPLDRARR